MNNNTIVVRSHVARDLLQNAALFKTEKLVVWEYVSNGLQYVDRGTSPVVRVTIDSRRKRITVADNGRGMDQAGLQNFFVMHGENLDRKAGRRGRGRFGTGKCAAFGIGERLRVTSIQNGRLNSVELRRDDIDPADERQIPVEVLEVNRSTDEPNGTIVEITDIRLRSLDQRSVIRYIERHLARWPSKPTVIVNNHECEYREPSVARIDRIRPDGEAAEALGDVELVLKVAKAPLDPEMQGIAIFAHGVWLETTLAGAEGQPMAQYIFGEIDVPVLDEDTSSIAAYDMSRSMQLNRNNELVMVVLAFVGRQVDLLRRELARVDRAKRAEMEAKRLQREASLIAEMINDDFREFSDRVARVKARGGVGRDPGPTAARGGPETDVLVNGGSIPAEVREPDGGMGRGMGRSGSNGNPPDRGPVLTSDEDGQRRGDPAGGDGKTRTLRGGFRVAFKEMGGEAERAVYTRSERTIFVNLDHPQVSAARGAQDEKDPSFRRLAYEVAFAEYAVALASELAEQDEYIEPSDPIFDIRETLNRMARKAAALYAA